MADRLFNLIGQEDEEFLDPLSIEEALGFSIAEPPAEREVPGLEGTFPSDVVSFLDPEPEFTLEDIQQALSLPEDDPLLSELGFTRRKDPRHGIPTGIALGVTDIPLLTRPITRRLLAMDEFLSRDIAKFLGMDREPRKVDVAGFSSGSEFLSEFAEARERATLEEAGLDFDQTPAHIPGPGDPLIPRERLTPDANIMRVFTETGVSIFSFLRLVLPAGGFLGTQVARTAAGAPDRTLPATAEEMGRIMNARELRRAAGEPVGLETLPGGESSFAALRAVREFAAPPFRTAKNALKAGMERLGIIKANTTNLNQAAVTADGAIPSAQAAGGAMTTFLLNTVRTAAENPRLARTAEVSALFGAAGAGAVAEGIFPDQPIVRAGAEVTGGFLSLPALLSRGTLGAASITKDLAQRAFRAGKDDEAALAYVGIIEALGGDVDKTINLLERANRAARAAGVRGDLPAAGTFTGDEILLAAQRKLEAGDADFLTHTLKKQREFFDEINELHRGLMLEGSPEALTAAATLRSQNFTNRLDELFARHHTAAAGATSRILRDLPNTNPETVANAHIRASEATYEILEGAIRQARETETFIWGLVNKDIPVPAGTNTSDKFREIFRDVDPEAIPSIAIRVLRRADEGGRTGQFLELNSELTDAIRQARAAGKYKEANRLSRLKSGLLEDLADIDDPAIRAANEFTIALNDRFTRTFLGASLGDVRTGASRVSPEEFLDRALAGSYIASARRFEEMRDAAGFADKARAFRDRAESVRSGRLLEGEASIVPGETDLITAMGFFPSLRQSVIDEQEAFLRTLAGQFLKEDGTVDAARLSKFVNSEPTLLEAFPGLKAELVDATSASRLFDQIQASNETLGKHFANLTAVGRILGTQRPESAVGRILSGDNPFSDYRQLAQTVKKAETTGFPSTGAKRVDGAIDGLKHATILHAKSQAERGETFSWVLFKNNLNEPMAAGQPSLIKLMQREGVITADEVKRLNQIVDLGVQVEQAIGNPARLAKLIDDPSAVMSLVASMIGTRAGTFVGKKTGVIQPGGAGPSLVVAQRSASMARDFFNKVPITRKTHAMMLLIESPEAMEIALKNVAAPRDRARVGSQLNTFLLGVGLPTSDMTAPEFEPEFPIDPVSEFIRRPQEGVEPSSEGDFLEELELFLRGT